MTEGLSRIPDMPYAIKEQPTLTFVARQQGEAWNRPFVAVYEPSSVKEPGCISSVTFPEVESGVAGSHVGICIQQKEGRVDRIISSDDAGHLCKSGEMTVQAAYALWGNKQGDDCIFFLGGGMESEILQSSMALNTTPNMTVIAARQPANEWIEMLHTINFTEIGILFIAYFIGGYLLYSSLFAAIGSAVDGQEDTQQFMLPVTLLLVFASMRGSIAWKT